jgi:hypothetical protein
VTALAILIEYPWLALLPALLFGGLYRASRRRIVASAALAWAVYAGYEYAMLRRWLCSGECNIRVDLLLLYPALLAISAAAVIGAVRAKRRRAAASSPRRDSG